MEQITFSCNSVPLLFCRYCKAFQYLLRLKRIQLELEKSWAEAMQQDRADSAKQRKDAVNGTSATTQRQQHRMPMWRIRQHMTYLITNLQFYIQVHYHTHFFKPRIMLWLSELPLDRSSWACGFILIMSALMPFWEKILKLFAVMSEAVQSLASRIDHIWMDNFLSNSSDDYCSSCRLTSLSHSGISYRKGFKHPKILLSWSGFIKSE